MQGLTDKTHDRLYVVTRYTILLNLLEERHVRKKRCYCKRQLCHKWFIPTFEDQETCIFDLAERGAIHEYLHGKRKLLTEERKKEEKKEIKCQK